jgi:NADPH:quinone reductase-like Zn-dependent oxidoreductase
VTGLRVGDAVTSYTYQAGIGHYAEYVAVPANLVAAAPISVDALLDCVGGKTAASSLLTLRDGGRMASIVDLEQVKPRQGISARLFYVRADVKQLGELARLVDTGQLSVHLDQVFPLEEARQAHQRLEGRHNRGKIVLSVQ